MIEEFFGAWHVEVVAPPYPGLPIPPMKLVISGSEGSDGTWVQPAWPDSFEVSGERWTLETFLANDTPPFWRPRTLGRSTAFTRTAGLVVTLGDRSSPLFTCTSRDEQISPPPEPNPYDFTIPERG